MFAGVPACAPHAHTRYALLHPRHLLRLLAFTTWPRSISAPCSVGRFCDLKWPAHPHFRVWSLKHDLRDQQVAYKLPRHRWAVVSGSIDPEDPSPQAAAWREIREETTLTQSSLELMRQGKSYVLPDESIGRKWTIYPFAFRLKEASEGGKGEDAIQLDWEHETWAWYDPFEVEDSESFGAVPRLAESLRRVWLVNLSLSAIPIPPGARATLFSWALLAVGQVLCV